MTRHAARLALLLACVVLGASEVDFGSGVGDADATSLAADDAARSLQSSTPAWLAARSQRQFRITGDTWHRIAADAGDATAANEAPPEASQTQPQRGGGSAHYYYNERTRATAWQLPRHHARGTPLWALKAGSNNRLGPPIFDTSALSFPDCAADWATILLPAAIFAAAKHAGAVWRAVRDATRDAAAVARALRGPGGAASKAD